MTFEFHVMGKLLIRTTIILLIVSVIARLLQRTSASVRHGVWVLGFLSVLAVPVVSGMFPTIDLPLLSDLDSTPVQSADRSMKPVGVGESPSLSSAPITSRALTITPRAEMHEDVVSPISIPNQTVRPRWTWMHWLVLFWGLGSLGVAASWLVALASLRKLTSTSTECTGDEWQLLLRKLAQDLGVTELPKLRMASEPVPPMTWGVFRHVILLPDGAKEWPSSRRRLVLAHELAHVRRSDGLTQLMAECVCSLYWFNPLVWYAAGRLQFERERACDDHVLRLGASAIDYADHLLQIARGLNSRFTFAVVSMAHPGQLKSRLQAILDPRMHRQALSRATSAVLLVVIAILTLSAGAIQLTAVQSMVLPAATSPGVPGISLRAEAAPSVVQQTTVPTSVFSIDGTVVGLEGGAPIDKVTVELRSLAVVTPTLPQGMAALPAPQLQAILQSLATPAISDTFTTKADGRFEFSAVPAGEYRLYATRDTGYIPVEYGQRGPVGTGIPLIVETGQKITGIRLSMARTASISGRILDHDGDPVTYASVNLLRKVYRAGEQTWIIAQGVGTNDLGEYRFRSLPPGEYYVAAQPWDMRTIRVGPSSFPTIFPNRFASTQAAGAPAVIRKATEKGDVVEEVLRPIYYPGSPDGASAQPLSLQPGINISGIDINVGASGVPARHVRGNIIDVTTGSPAVGAIVRLVPRDNAEPVLGVPNATADRNGTFDVQGVGSGAYSLFVSGSLTGYAVIDVGNKDLEGLQIVGSKSIDIPWRGSFDDGIDDQDAIGRLRITLTRDPDIIGPRAANGVGTAGWAGVPDGQLTPQSTADAARGGYVLQNVAAGDYRLSISGLPPGAYVKSIRQGPTDVVREGIRVLATPERPIEIVLGRKGGAIDGRVLNGNLEPVANVRVALVPALNRSRTELYRSVITNSAGRFRLDGIAPDRYKLFAWEDVVVNSWYDESFLRTYESRGVSIEVLSGGLKTADVEVIAPAPARSGQ